jgi:hypothetical protein
MGVLINRGNPPDKQRNSRGICQSICMFNLTLVYSTKCLVVSFIISEFYIKQLKNMAIHSPKVSAFDLLKKILFFIPNYSNLDDLNLDLIDEDENEDDKKSKAIKKNQIIILSKIFIPEISQTVSFDALVKTILSGDFLYKREISKYKDVIIEMEYFMSLNNSHISVLKQSLDAEDRIFELYNLQFNYTECLKYQRQLNSLFNFCSGIKESSYRYYYAEIMTKYTSRTINTRGLEDFLSKIIDPDVQLFTWDDLKENYNYPADYIYPRYD